MPGFGLQASLMVRWLTLGLGQVGGQVVGEPAVAGPEGLGPGGLGVPHDAEPIAEGLEGDYFVVPDPEPLPAACEVDVLGREPEHPGVGVDRLLPLYGPAAEGAGPVVQAPGDPDAHAPWEAPRRSPAAQARASNSRLTRSS